MAKVTYTKRHVSLPREIDSHVAAVARVLHLPYSEVFASLAGSVLGRWEDMPGVIAVDGQLNAHARVRLIEGKTDFVILYVQSNPGSSFRPFAAMPYAEYARQFMRTLARINVSGYVIPS
jgi:hypothetical protein